MFYNVVFFALYVISFTAIGANGFLIYIAARFSQKIGSFKYMVLAFASLESVYSLVVLLTIPVFYTQNDRLIIFSYKGVLSQTAVASYAAGLYCTFYEMWIGFVVIMFINRYIVVCKESWSELISKSRIVKLILFMLYFCHVAYSFLCGVYWCVQDRIPEKIANEIREKFTIGSQDTLGYMVTTLKRYDDSFSWNGAVSYGNHFALLAVSSFTIIFCGYKTWKGIQNMTAGATFGEVKRMKEIFFTIVLQGTIPLVTYQFPSFVIILYGLLYGKPVHSSLTTFMSLLLLIPKLIDPILALFVIREYRNAAIAVFRGNNKVTEKSFISVESDASKI